MVTPGRNNAARIKDPGGVSQLRLDRVSDGVIHVPTALVVRGADLVAEFRRRVNETMPGHAPVHAKTVSRWTGHGWPE